MILGDSIKASFNPRRGLQSIGWEALPKLISGPVIKPEQWKDDLYPKSDYRDKVEGNPQMFSKDKMLRVGIHKLMYLMTPIANTPSCLQVLSQSNKRKNVLFCWRWYLQCLLVRTASVSVFGSGLLRSLSFIQSLRMVLWICIIAT